LPMRGTGVAARAKSRICRAKMALRLMAETAMPREAAFFNGLLVGSFRFMVWSFSRALGSPEHGSAGRAATRALVGPIPSRCQCGDRAGECARCHLLSVGQADFGT
jgi:hypothetical protein